MTGDQQPSDLVNKRAQRLDLDFVLQAAGLGTWELDSTTNLVRWDDRCRALYGLTNDNDLPYAQAIQYIHPDDVNRVDQAVQWAMNPDSGGVYDQTYRTTGGDDGQLRWVRFQGRAYFNEARQVVRFTGIAQELTQQVITQQQEAKARQQAQESEAKLRSIINSAPTAMGVFVGPDMVVENPNQLLIELLGQGPELEGKSFRQLLSGVVEEDQKFIQLIDTVRTSGQPFEANEVAVFFKVDRRTRYFNISFVPLRDESGIINAVLDVSVEVTPQVVARQAIESNEHILRDMVLWAPIGISILNAADLVIETVNDAFMEVAGKSYEQLVGQPYWVPFAEAAPYYADALSRVAQQGEPFSINEVELMLIRHGQEELIYVTFVYMPLKDGAGRVQKIVVWVLENTHQVTQRRQVEELVQQRTEELDAANTELAVLNQELKASNEEYAALNEELMATGEEIDKANRGLEEANRHLIRSNQNLEQFAYIASHDLQEPLRKIQQFGDLLKQRYATAGGEELSYLDRMQTAASRMSLLIKDLLAFSRISTSQAPAVLVNLNQVVTQALETLSVPIEETGAHIQVDTLPTIQGDGSQLSQLFQNLLSNAIKFSQKDQSGQTETPQITIRANELSAADLPASVKPPRPARVYYQIDVTDNGIGFEEKYLDRIFQVFQRLHGKNEFAGTGVGLAIVQKVVTNHGGTITASSQPGQGATFSVYLPA